MATPYGLTVAGLDYSGVAEDEFDDWYDLEHIPERLVIKGVLGAERWIGVDNPKLSIVTVAGPMWPLPFRSCWNDVSRPCSDMSEPDT